MHIDHTVKGWKLFYKDGSTYSSNDGAWADAPINGVQVLVVYENGTDGMGRNMRIIHSGKDFYYKDGDSYGCYFDGEDNKAEVKNGELVSDEEYKVVIDKVVLDYEI